MTDISLGTDNNSMTYGEWHKIMREQIANENLMELLCKIERLEKMQKRWQDDADGDTDSV